MIAQVLNRKFVLEQLERVKSQLLEGAEADRRGSEVQAEFEVLTQTDREYTLEKVDETLTKERANSSGQPSYKAPPSERRGEPEPAPIDDFSFFSRDPVVSNLQSALDQYFEEKAPSEVERIVVKELADDGRRGESGDIAVTDRSLLDSEPQRASDGRRLFGRFEVTDPGWISSAVAMGIRKFRGKHKFPTQPPKPLKMKSNARLLLVGDWGSGIPRAQKVADQMRRFIDGDRRENRAVHVIHLGDIYYSGWKREYESRFLEYWPVKSGEEIGSWCLNGNHDMYSGGHDYFDFLLSEPRFNKQGGSSYFSFYNESWKILAVDTAWEDDDLVDPQVGWARETVLGSNAKLMLLSHHQPFSAYESAGKKIAEKLGFLLGTNRVCAWFWGHEHRCMLFKSYENVNFGRCIGHGGVPVYMWHQPNDPYPEPGEYEYRQILDNGLEHWALFGFAVLDFEGPSVHVRYVDENGYEYKSEDIS
jgi:hypothetical protein